MFRTTSILTVMFLSAAAALTQEERRTYYRPYVIGDGTVANQKTKFLLGDWTLDKKKADDIAAAWNLKHPIGESNRSADVEETDFTGAPPSSSADEPPKLTLPKTSVQIPSDAPVRKTIRVSVHKLVDGKYVRQTELDLDTDDYDKASEYYWQNKSKGFTVSWHDSKGRKPKIVGSSKLTVDVEGTYKPPQSVVPKVAVPAKNPSDEKALIGRWVRETKPAVSRSATVTIYEFLDSHTVKYHSWCIHSEYSLKPGVRYGEEQTEFSWSAKDGKIIFGGYVDHPWTYEIKDGRLKMSTKDYTIELERSK